jgi:hypothetical protein
MPGDCYPPQSAKYRRTYCVLTGTIALLLFLVYFVTTPGDLDDSPFQDIGEGEFIDISTPGTSTPINVHNDKTQPKGRYKYLVLIGSDALDHSRRKLLREKLFGIRDNLIHCLKNTSNVQYRFLVKDNPSINNLGGNASPNAKSASRRYASELMEFGDIDKLPSVRGDKWIESVLKLVSFDERVTLDQASVRLIYSIRILI